MMKTHAPRALGALCMLLALAGTLCWRLAACATDARYLAEGFARYADTAASGVPAQEYPALALALAQYLGGQAASPQIECAGGRGLAWNERELAHLSDVRALVKLARGIDRGALWALAALSAVLAPGLLRARAARKRFLQGLCLCAGGTLLLLLALGAWAAADFDSLFILFHRALFTNDLWLLNPQTDLLIQLMPTPFFTACAARVLREFALLFAAACFLAACVYFAARDQRKKNQP